MVNARKVIDTEENKIMLWLNEQFGAKKLSMEAITKYFLYTTRNGGYDVDSYINNLQSGAYNHEETGGTSLPSDRHPEY